MKIAFQVITFCALVLSFSAQVHASKNLCISIFQSITDTERSIELGSFDPNISSFNVRISDEPYMEGVALTQECSVQTRVETESIWTTLKASDHFLFNAESNTIEIMKDVFSEGQVISVKFDQLF